MQSESINLQINNKILMAQEEAEESPSTKNYEAGSPSGKTSPGKGYQKVRSKVAGNLKSQERAKMNRGLVEAARQERRDLLAGTTDVRAEQLSRSPGKRAGDYSLSGKGSKLGDLEQVRDQSDW